MLAFDVPEWQPPKVVLLDTNVVAEALLADQPEHSACLAVSIDSPQGARPSCSVVCWRSSCGRSHSISRCVSATPARTSATCATTTASGRAPLGCLARSAKAWEKMLDSLVWSRVEIHEVAPEVPRLMQDYGFQSYDAVHAATLIASEATDFVTRDGGFAVLPPAVATLHTTQARLAGTRARRRRAGYR